MSRRPYPAVSIIVSNVSYSKAEVALDELAKLENFQETNNESKFERKTVNGETEISGYIKRSIKYTGETCTFSIHPSFTAKESDLKVVFTDTRSETADRFSDIITVFEKYIFPLLEEYLTDVPEPKVTTKSI